MKPLYPSLIFPDTDIFTYRQFPLLLFTAPLYFLQPVESDPEEGESGLDIFLKSGLVQTHCPAPLNEDRGRFMHLIDDIRNRKDDYAAQLSALTMAAMSSPDEESSGEKRYQIISAMLGSSAAPASKDNDPRLDLWQARLVLAISEILKKEEDDLQQELQLLDAQEVEMFRSLQGDIGSDETDPFSELERITARLESGRPREAKMLFRSWLKLMKTAPTPDISLFLASSVDGGDQLLNEFDRKHDQAALPILELNLPDRIEAGPTHVVSQVQRFHDDSAEVREQIYGDLESLVNKDRLSLDSAENLLPTGPDYISRWNDLVEDHFPAGSHAVSSLLFYLLPNCPIADLLGLTTSTAAPRSAHGLFAVLKR